jgi:hypothetical protein
MSNWQYMCSLQITAGSTVLRPNAVIITMFTDAVGRKEVHR